MGVLNITPDSFSDGGRWSSRDQALAHAREMLAAGAEILDLGAESTRPGGGVYGSGAATVPVEEECARLLPVLIALRAAAPDAILSVDTRKAAVAAAALAAGADLINDISALGDPEMAAVVANSGCPIVLMHSRGELAAMQRDIHFADVVAEVRAEQATAVARATASGIPRSQILLDPGLGFGKTTEQNLALLAHLDALTALGLPVLVGASRKSFVGQVTGAPVDRRLPGSLAALAWAARFGAAVVRVHDVPESLQFLAVWQAIAGQRSGARDPRADAAGPQSAVAAGAPA